MLNAKTTTALTLAGGLWLAAGWMNGAEAAGQGTSGDTTGTLQSPAQAQDFRARGNDLIDRDVVNQRGDEVGELEDLVTDSSGRLYGVVEVGDVAGIGGKNILIPVDQLKIGQDNLTLMSQESEDALQQKPAYDEAKYKSIINKGMGGTRSGEPARSNPQ
jgi:hypothetical protein